MSQTGSHLTPIAAFEVRKGDLPLRFLGEADVERCLDPAGLLDALADGFAALERGEVQLPPRPQVTVPGAGFSLAMPAWRPGGPIGVKVVNVFDANLDIGLPNHLALITLFDAATGAAVCTMDGTFLTGARTAGAAVLSARLVGRADARRATIVGAGVQAREHLRLLPLLGSIERIDVCSLEPEHAERLAELSPLAVASTDVAASVAASDVVCLTTHSASPVIEAAWVEPGTHVTSVGYHPPDGELPRELATTARLFVESDDALAPPPVGCSELDGVDRGTATRLGQVVLDPSLGRRTPDEITVYKAMGVAIEDLVAADLVHRAAVERGIGTVVTW